MRIVLAVFGVIFLCVGLMSIVFEIGASVFISAIGIIGVLLLLFCFLIPSTNIKTSDMVVTIGTFLKENELKPAHKKHLSEIANRLSSLYKHSDIIESLLKNRSYGIHVKYIQLIMPIQEELDEKVKKLLERIEIFNCSVIASHGQKSAKLDELEQDCTESAKNKLLMINLYIEKIESLRNELANENDDETWLRILGKELDELTENLSLYE